MKKYEKMLLYISMILLLIMTFISGYAQEGNWILKVAAVVVVFVPAVFSAIPLFTEYRLRKNRSINRLSDNTFTDREEDVKNILNKLLVKEHIIEISSDDKHCGKTWIAKKIVDYINFPKDISVNRIRLPYKLAYYLDLDIYDEQQIEDFFNNHIINSNVVLIFDNVNNFNYLLSKQSLYHFQLIYILKKAENNSYFKHSVSKFSECNIKELHEKIRYNYPGIQSISEDEIKVLYKITNGNIGKISSILSKQTSVKWLKDISLFQRTEYDDILDSINLILFAGKYECAKTKLDKFEEQNKEHFQENNDLYFKYIMIKADCEHLLNQYEQAIALLSIIENYPYYIYNKNYELELHKAHYLKHIWKCNDALKILYAIRKQSFSAKVDSLGILLAKHFIGDEYVPESEQTSLEEFYNTYIDAENDNIFNQDIANKLKHQRYTAIYRFYKDKPENPETLISTISKVIEIYKSQNNRLQANAYFIRGELYRLYGKYEDALNDYKLCLSVTDDNNIALQTNLMVFYLVKCKKMDLDFNFLSHDKILQICKHNNYGKRIYHRINSVLLGDPNAEHIIRCFETRIMPIL